MAHNRRGAANKTATTAFTAAAMSTNNIIMGMILAVWILVVGVTATTTAAADTAADTAAGNDAANTRLVRHGSNGHVRHRHLQRFNLTLDDDVNMDDVNPDDDTDDILTTNNGDDDDTNIDDRMIDDQGELLDDASTNNGTAEDDDEWYLPESKIPLFDLIQASPFGAGDSQDWGVASIVAVSSSSGTTDNGSANSDTEDDDDDNDDDDDDDDGETIRKTKVITTIDKIMHNLHSTPVPITTSTSSSSSTSSSLINTFNAATTSTKKEEESTTNTNNNNNNNIISISAGNIHSVILTRQGIVMTAGSVGLMEEDRGLGRSLDAAVVVAVDVDSTITTSHDDDDDGADDDAATIVEDDKFDDTTNSTISHDIFKFHPVTQVYIHDSYDDSHTLLTSSSSTTTTTSNSNNNSNNNNKDDFPTFTKIVTSQYFTYLLDTNGHVYSSGINTHGQLCLNDTTSRDRFHQIPSLFFELESDEDYSDNDGDGVGVGVGVVKNRQVPIVDIALGERHALFLREDGVVFACGWNAYGQLGLGERGVDAWSPRRVIIDEVDEVEDENKDDGGMNDNATDATTKPTIDTQTITHIAAGRGSSYFRTASGHVFSTGTNYEGQLCLGHRDDRTLPSLVLTTDDRDGGDYGGVQDIIAGKSSLYLLMGDGYVLSCGSNMHGQLGDGGLLDSRDVPLPVIVGGGTAATPDTTIGGGDDDDDFGNATTIDVLRNVTRIFSGPIAFNAFFLTSDGVIYGVGYNGSGQLGVGDRVNRNVATVVACSDTVSNDEKDNNNENDVVWTREVILNKTVISSGNDHTLFLGGEDTFIGCTVDSSSTSKGPTTSPQETTPSPTSSTSPTESHMPSESPTISSAPSTSQMPSGTPTVSSSPTISPMPTPGETDWPTPPLTSVEPTITPAPTLSHVPTGVSASPMAGAVTSPGSDRNTSGGVGTRLIGGCHGGTLVFVMMTCLWQWL